MRILFFILFVLFSSNAFCQMPTYTLQTGYAYDTCNGQILGKYMQNAGDVVVLSPGCTITDVANQAALNAISLYNNPATSFNTDLFVQQLAQTSLISDPNLFSFYAVMKDMTYFYNWQGLANLIGGLLQSGVLNQSEVDVIDNTLENQQINLDSYNSEVNVAY